MQFKVEFTQDISSPLYEDYCRFIFESITRDLRDQIVSAKYKVREKVLLKSNFIQWDTSPPPKIDLVHYVVNCLDLHKVYGVYEIRLDPFRVISGSSTRVGSLIRLLEYGCPGFPALPFVRRIMFYYSQHYKEMLVNFMKERLS